ncbi:MAG: helicase-exonuclease AddAB subunit AddA [Clostridia bacterium]|nr:helicase-exonuclease AddAB subunit AddA [Clostridia bacterium]
MRAVKWTADQQKAIDARKGTLLVSAAAGSGKTAVLVERVIQRICDSENPCGVENLLIVTFTNAAASQMKDKIFAAIGKKIALNPSDKRLRRQQLMLPFANICTIDSFCIGLVRENFHALGIAPDFALLDEGKLGLLRNQAVSAVAEALYKESSESFVNLCELISDKKDDKKLIDAILKLYDLSQAYPFPEKWLNSLAEEFDNPRPLKESSWGRIILSYVQQSLDSCVSDAEHCISLLADEPELEAKYRPAFEDDRALFENMLESLRDDSWDDFSLKAADASFARMAAAPKGYTGELKDICKGIRDAYKKRFASIAGCVGISENEHKDDVEKLSPVIAELVNAVTEYGKEFRRLKREENGADFSDTLHMALELLVEPTENGYAKTPLAYSLSENYAEILVDEYQDVNKAQDLIFSALSKEESNLFMVGDVKQSIYRFRQAMPEIFLSRRDGMEEYENGNYPAKVTLGKNFRSRKGVTDIVNFIFSSLMSRDAGGLDYDKNEFLEAAASYPESGGADTELCLIETEDSYPAQAKYIAEYIEKAIAEGMAFTEGDTQRMARYGDFCILLRSVKGCAKAFVDELTARGIPVSCEAGESFISSPEIMFMTSLLKVIDNPVDDIPLTAVLMSPVFGFTADDLSFMRAAQKKGPVYQCVVSAAENGNEKAASFLKRTADMRRIASTVSATELIRRLISETGYGAIVSTMKDSEKRRANLNSFIDLASRYESTGKKGVAGFVRYIDSISKGGIKISSGSSDSESGDSVKIMTIHKSKGLEFPVCFLAACEKKYNELSTREDLLIAPESGIGIKNSAGFAKFDTLPRIAAKLEITKAEHSEELRVLYVALTRPKEKLIILASAPDWSKELSKIAAGIRDEKLIDPFTVIGFSNYAKCILSALIRHPDAHVLRNAAGVPSSIAFECKASLAVKIIQDCFEEQNKAEEHICEKADSKIVSEIKERLAYVYPYASLEGVVAKRIASKLDSEGIGGEFFASRRPAFVGKDKLTPAQRGTATHRFMQYADYSLAGESVEKEIERLVQNGMLTEIEADVVDKKAISQFFSGSLARRILNAEKVYKEYAFTVALPLCEMNPGIPENEARGETVVIEGVADCAFVENGELVVVDFKTDRASDESVLVEHYREQLSVYRRCLSEVIGLPVKETVIYSFSLGKTIEISQE